MQTGEERTAEMQSSRKRKEIQIVWWFGTFGLFSHHIGNVIIPTDELIFFRGVGSTTNQQR